MCGIAGYYTLNEQPVADTSVLRRMTDAIAHRGPDGEGFFIEGAVALGHRRLSIIDLETGSQPMCSSNGKKVLVFNGEIYNYIELRDELMSLGYSFTTTSDTEVILKAYEAWGYDCQARFNGMWALALWDKDKQELFLSRDRFGEKPLHYCLLDGVFIFGSEIKAVLAYGVPAEIRPELIELYLVLTNIPAPDTFYKHIYKLLPGHYLLLKDGKLSEKIYWEFPQVAEENMLRDAATVYRKFEELLTDAVRIRMRSDVPFGAFLSGGLDSSGIVSLMAGQSTFPVNTFTIGFADKEFDESKRAALVATAYKTDHRCETVLPSQLQDTIKRIAKHFDEPFGDSSAIPTDVVSCYASEYVKMVLTGDGGDEALSGYNAYKGVKVTATLRRYLPGMLMPALTGAIGLCAKFFVRGFRHRLRKINRTLKSAQLPFYLQMAENTAFADLETIKAMTRPIKNVIPVEAYFESLMDRCRFQDDFYKLMYVHYHHHLPNDFLVKVDRMSMANSLETRLPFLDHRLVEFMAGVHKDIKMQGFELKSVLRNSIGNKIPAEILQAPKQGFAIPLREWFKDKAFDTLLRENLDEVGRMLDAREIAKIVSENQSGKKDHGNFIWSLLQLNQIIKRNAQSH